MRILLRKLLQDGGSKQVPNALRASSPVAKEQGHLLQLMDASTAHIYYWVTHYGRVYYNLEGPHVNTTLEIE